MVDGLPGQFGQAVAYHVQMAQGQDIDTAIILFLGMVEIHVMKIQYSSNNATLAHVPSMVDGQPGQIGPIVQQHVLGDLS